MSDEKKKMVAYSITEHMGKEFWTRIGKAVPTRDGEGFLLILDALPIDGKIHLRNEVKE